MEEILIGDIVDVVWENDAEYDVEVIYKPIILEHCWILKRRDGILIYVNNFCKIVKARKEEIKIKKLDKNMKIYKLENPMAEYDDIFTCFVCAGDEEEAKRIIPCSYYILINDEYYYLYDDGTKEKESIEDWCHFKDVIVTYVGVAKEGLKKGLI